MTNLTDYMFVSFLTFLADIRTQCGRGILAELELRIAFGRGSVKWSWECETLGKICKLFFSEFLATTTSAG